MELIQSIILGIIQGLTEFLPISSSAHLVLTPRFFSWPDQGLAFDVALHLGTLVAVVSYFWKDWMEMSQKSIKSIKSKVKSPLSGGGWGWVNLAKEEPIPNPSQEGNNKFAIPSTRDSQFRNDKLFIIILATIPGILAGLFLNNYSETIFRNPAIIIFTLSGGAILLYLSDKLSKKNKSIKNLTLKMGIIIGLAQALAIIPGISRSGITITAALLLGMNRAAAARFSFLLATPIIFGAGIYEMPYLIKNGIDSSILVGILVSAISGYLAIKYMLRYLENKSYNIFVWYRLILAGVVFWFLL